MLASPKTNYANTESKFQPNSGNDLRQHKQNVLLAKTVPGPHKDGAVISNVPGATEEMPVDSKFGNAIFVRTSEELGGVSAFGFIFNKSVTLV